MTNTGAHGFGHAVRCGLDAFTGDAVTIVMADGSDSPDDLVRYFYVLRDRAECAFGSRFAPGSEVIDYPRFKLFVNRLANWFIKVLFGFRYNDVTNAFKGYRANVIEGCRPFLSPHFNLTVEIPLKAIVRGLQLRDAAHQLAPAPPWRLQPEAPGDGQPLPLHRAARVAREDAHRGDYRRVDAGQPFRPSPSTPSKPPPAGPPASERVTREPTGPSPCAIARFPV